MITGFTAEHNSRKERRILSAEKSRQCRPFSVMLMLLLMIFGCILTFSVKEFIVMDQQNSALNTRLAMFNSQLVDLQSENDQLTRENQDLTAQKDQITNEILTEQGFSQLAYDLAKARNLAGFTDVSGAGLTITLNDSTVSDTKDTAQEGLIHSQDVLYVIEVLKSLGAKAIAVNGERIVNTSVVTCLGPTIRVNNTRHPVPFIITAVCDPTVGKAYFDSDSYLAYRRENGVDVTVESSTSMIIPAFTDTAEVDEVYSVLSGKEGSV